MKSGNSGTLLGFSMTGVMLQKTSSPKPEDNIIFTLTTKIKEKSQKEVKVALEKVILAGKGGTRLEVNTHPFLWKRK